MREKRRAKHSIIKNILLWTFQILVVILFAYVLLDRGLISGDVCGRAREKVLGTLDLPPFFRNGEDADGSSENPR